MADGDASAPAGSVILERIRKQFNQQAGQYDQGTIHAELAQKLVELCQLQQGGRLLDLAAGTGMVALPAAAIVGPTGHVTAVDLSQGMLDQAAAKAQAQGLTNMQFICGNMEELSNLLPPDPQQLFDAATCSAATPFLVTPQQTFAAWRAHLKPGGRLAINTFVPPAIEEHALFVRMAHEYGYEKEVDPFAVLGSPELITQALTQAGYSNIQVTSEDKDIHMPRTDPQDHAFKMWRFFLNNNPFRGPEELEAVLGADTLHAFQEAFMAAVVLDVVQQGRWDADKQQVLNRRTILHVLACT